MLGAIIGDMVGSPYEWERIKTTDFEFWTDECGITDDSILSLAIADALVSAKSYEATIREWVQRFPYSGYGEMFFRWAMDPHSLPYGSFGNGSAMRVSPVGWAFNTLETTLLHAERTAECSHNHPEGIKGAKAVGGSIWIARAGGTKRELTEFIQDEIRYNVSVPLDKIRPTYGMDETCQGTVPQAIRCVLEADSFEETIRLAVSLGGDSDTLAAIAGSIAEPMFGIPDDIGQKAIQRLTDTNPIFTDVLKKFREKFIYLEDDPLF